MGKTLVIFGCSVAAAFAQYVGAKVCGSCHAEWLRQQSASEHARALHPVAEHPLASLFAKDSAAAPSAGYVFARTPTGFVVRIETSNQKQKKVIPVQWAFGAGDQAVTFASQFDEDSYLEHRFSFYARTGELGLTPGHPALAEGSYPGAAGVVYKTFDPEARIMRCFQCHSTGRLSLGEHMELMPGELGVRCEACHGPGKAHVDAVAAGKLAEARKAIQDPARMTAVEQNQFCGDCHRKPQQGETATNWNDPWNTRHQPLYLAQSACFRRSNSALTCLTCHDAHSPLRRGDAAFYNAKCAACHVSGTHPVLAPSRSTQDCVSCHMPPVSPREHLQFTNHWIGVYREGSPLKPRVRPIPAGPA
jgi:hypothetical protein